MKAVLAALLLTLSVSAARAQNTEAFFYFGSGGAAYNPHADMEWWWNYSFGVEKYYINKISLALSYRRAFNILGGNDQEYFFTDAGDNYNYRYTEKISTFSIDFESKFFFDDIEEGWYISSGIGYQPVHTDIVLTEIELNYMSNPKAIPVMSKGEYEEDAVVVFPLTLRMGQRESGHHIVFDYFFGLNYYLGPKETGHKYPYFDYPTFRHVSLVVGFKTGINF